MKLQRARIACAALSILLSALSCSAQEPVPDKLDAPLRQRIENAEARNDPASIAFLGRCRRVIDSGLRTHLERSGVHVETVAGDIFTAAGAPSRIRELARDPEVVSLSLSVERFPATRPMNR